MKRSTEFLVAKRDGRREYLRSTKLARSIHLALIATGDGEQWRAVDVAASVLAGLRHRRGLVGCAEGAMLTTDDLARAVERVLSATGFPRAASCYSDTRAERQRRRQILSSRASASGLLDVTAGARRFECN